MIQLKNCVLRCKTPAELGILENYEALEYAKPEGIRDVFWCNKTPVILASDTSAGEIEGYPVIDIPSNVIGNDAAFTDFCHSKGIECGEYRTGKVFNTSDEDCFLCRIANLMGFGSLAKYNQYVQNPVDCIIYESENFVVIPEKGAMGKLGFLMVVSKHHYLSAAQFPKEVMAEYKQLLKDVEKILLKAFNGRVVAFWEHGSNPDGLSSHKRAVVHFHVHILVDWTMEKVYQDRLQMVPCEDITIAKNSSYLSYQEGTDGILMISMDPRVFRPRQAPRQMIALGEGLPEGYYNWRYYDFKETTEITLLYLHKALVQWPEGRIYKRTRGFVDGYAKRLRKEE